MGHSRWDPGTYTAYSNTVSSKSTAQIFTHRGGCHDDLNPKLFAVRESCDSALNPASTPVMIGVDETGSMGYLAGEIIRNGLGVIVKGIYDRKPVTDPHILLAALGDAHCDSAPIQTTQFEADVSIVKQIENFFLEGNGGGNGGESYPILWHFALTKTKCDAIQRHGRRGYLFTIGDEAPHMTIHRDSSANFLGVNVESDIKVTDLLASVQEQWNVFHLIVQTESTVMQDAVKKWRDLLGERAVVIDDDKRLGEIIVSLIQVNEGADARAVADSWGDSSTALVVHSAVSGIARRPGAGSNAIVEQV